MNAHFRNHQVRFPKGRPVVFAGKPKFWAAANVRWDIVDGEAEALLTLRSRATGRRRFNVKRSRLLVVSA